MKNEPEKQKRKEKPSQDIISISSIGLKHLFS